MTLCFNFVVIPAVRNTGAHRAFAFCRVVESTRLKEHGDLHIAGRTILSHSIKGKAFNHVLAPLPETNGEGQHAISGDYETQVFSHRLHVPDIPKWQSLVNLSDERACVATAVTYLARIEYSFVSVR